MIAPKRVSLLVVAFAALAGCGPRQVEVKTAPEPTATTGAPSVQLTNNLSQAVNVYVTVTGGNELFLRQVGAKSEFRFGISMEFADQRGYDGYNEHPAHVRFVSERWLPEVSDFLELDYTVLS